GRPLELGVGRGRDHHLLVRVLQERRVGRHAQARAHHHRERIRGAPGPLPQGAQLRVPHEPPVALDRDGACTHQDGIDLGALQVRELTGPESLVLVDDAPEPDRGDGILIDVHAAGVAFPDVLLTRGLYQLKPDPPFIPGSEVAGTVAEAAADAGFAPGDRVMAFTFGGFAERAASNPWLT